MTEKTPSSGGMVRTLGLTGVTMNAMALIAPGAFLWITFQIQASNTGGDTDMWPGIVLALIIALLTAFSFAELARRYPDAGAGGSYYFAEKAFLDRDCRGDCFLDPGRLHRGTRNQRLDQYQHRHEHHSVGGPGRF